MKIVHIITRLIVGGAQENTLITCRLLAEAGHDVTLVTGPPLGPEGDLLPQTMGQPYRTVIVPELRRRIDPVLDLISYQKIRGLLKAIQPHVLHTHSAKAGIIGRRAGFTTRPRPRIVHTIHGLPFHPYQSSLLNYLYIKIERVAAGWTDAFITVADAMAHQTKAAGIGQDKPYVTAYSAIAEQGFYEDTPEEQLVAFRHKYQIGPQAVVLVTVARLFKLKGHDYIIRSAGVLAKQFPKVIWLFVGDGSLTSAYKKQVAAMGLADRFRFAGLLPPSEIPLAIKASDILVHCSLREGLARALPQAMLCSRPVIAFDLDGSREVVNPSTGRLIPPGDVGALCAACAELIADPDLRKRLGSEGRSQVKERFWPPNMVETILQVYDRLLSQGI